MQNEKYILWSKRTEKIKINSKMNDHFYVNNHKKKTKQNKKKNIINLPTFCFLQSTNTSVKALSRGVTSDQLFVILVEIFVVPLSK